MQLIINKAVVDLTTTKGNYDTSPFRQARMTIDMPLEEYKRLKAMAAFMGITLKNLVLNCLRDSLLSYNEPKPNDETVKAFKGTDAGKGLVRCKDFNEFIDKFGLK